MLIEKRRVVNSVGFLEEIESERERNQNKFSSNKKIHVHYIHNGKKQNGSLNEFLTNKISATIAQFRFNAISPINIKQ